MPSERVVGRVGQIPKGEGRNFDVDGFRIAVFRTHADEIFATQAECPHRAGPLADGLLGGTTLVCPLHDWSFDLRTGEGSQCRIRTYRARVAEDGRILVALDTARGPCWSRRSTDLPDRHFVSDEREKECHPSTLRLVPERRGSRTSAGPDAGAASLDPRLD